MARDNDGREKTVRCSSCDFAEESKEEDGKEKNTSVKDIGDGNV